MATPDLSSSFISFNLSDEEIKAGRILSHETKALLKTVLAGIAEEKVAAKYTPDDHMGFIQREAYTSGRMDILKELINESLAAEQEAQESNS